MALQLSRATHGPLHGIGLCDVAHLAHLSDDRGALAHRVAAVTGAARMEAWCAAVVALRLLVAVAADDHGPLSFRAVSARRLRRGRNALADRVSRSDGFRSLRYGVPVVNRHRNLRHRDLLRNGPGSGIRVSARQTRAQPTRSRLADDISRVSCGCGCGEFCFGGAIQFSLLAPGIGCSHRVSLGHAIAHERFDDRTIAGNIAGRHSSVSYLRYASAGEPLAHHRSRRISPSPRARYA